MCCPSRPQRLLSRAKYHHRIGLAYHAWLVLIRYAPQTIYPNDIPMNCAYCHRPLMSIDTTSSVWSAALISPVGWKGRCQRRI
jgi:hypothetical protein